ncbi:hypothetical protein [Arthrobacter sp. H35-D1]|uniref:hypothetical protein n=1 Tax=Arthrobacter sp. H35-D1 TaxID=3046202 RepID=UPI0024B966E4|nr:hypothetical protein [Arthrobacter sp. H35-D1]MDJ0315184.1 hypothetical protein [Arthrobacter sp. H35-D1]
MMYLGFLSHAGGYCRMNGAGARAGLQVEQNGHGSIAKSQCRFQVAAVEVSLCIAVQIHHAQQNFADLQWKREYRFDTSCKGTDRESWPA